MYDWTQLVLPGRYFSWRMWGNSMQWALGERATLDQPFDVVFATSMLALASLKGLYLVMGAGNATFPNNT